MKTPIAFHNLWHQGTKTLVSIGGVAFALLLVFMQLGFMGAVSRTATNVLDNLNFDILIRARDYLHLYEPGQIDQKWLTMAKGMEGVVSAEPFWITIHNWRTLSPDSVAESDSRFETQYLPIAVLAFRPSTNLFAGADINASVDKRLLLHDRSILVDDSTQVDYGPRNGRKFAAADIDRTTEIGGQEFTIRGLFKLGTGLAANGAVITSDRGFARITPWDVSSTASLGLIQVDGDAEARQAVLSQLRSRASLSFEPSSEIANSQPAATGWEPWGWSEPVDSGAVTILTREEALARETRRWLWQTPIGLIFQLGVVLALMVGAAIVYMVLATDVANRLPEYATLLAIGYSRTYLASIVMTQAVVLGILGFLAAWGGAELMYRLTSAFSSIPLLMEPMRVAAVCLLGLVMCCLSGLLALRKLWKAEPASLF